jgi:hypothetical protein
MKTKTRILVPLFVLILLALSAVGVASAQNFSDISGTIRSAVTRQSASETEITGTITSITPETWTVDGTEFLVLPQTEVDGAFVVGDVVKVHLFSAADGSLTAREVEYAETGIANDDSNDNGAIDDDDSQEMDDDDSNLTGDDSEEIDDDNGNMSGNGGIEDNSNSNANDDNGNDSGMDDHSNDSDHHSDNDAHHSGGDDDGNSGRHGGDDDNGNGGWDD